MSRFYPSKEEFLKLAKKGNLIPVYTEILGDLDTPVSAFQKISQESKFSFLLESVEGEEKVARYSFLATDPELIVRSQGDQLEIIQVENGRQKREVKPITDTPLTHIRQIMRPYRFVNLPGLPRFCGGLVGYLGYDVVRFFETLPNRPRNDLRLPEALLVLAKDLVIFDHLNHKMKVVSCTAVDPKSGQQALLAAYTKAVNRINKSVAKIQKPLRMGGTKIRPKSGKPAVKSNFSKTAFSRIVNEAKQKIKAGDIIQVVLSQRFSVDLKVQPFDIYRALRSLNPSPYMYYLHFGDIQIVGSSPELLVRCEDNVVETRPIAGTRQRGKDEKEDDRLKADLLRDPKEKAEHIMLVDLGRNDLGRICRQGTVKVSEFMSVEKYSHVMHLVSNVRGILKPGKDAFDVLQAAFPAGTVSGAPKIRAMEIIDELENVSRGPYAGCIGYFSFSGNLDSCITIRTIVVADGKAYVQAGAGIVADSKPLKEYQETINKAKAQILAIHEAGARG